jgi:gas vesicle protein GvpG
MLLIDDILFAPARGILWILEEIHQAVKEEMVNETESITEQLRNLYMALETHSISEAQFDSGEKLLLDRLDSIEARAGTRAIAGETAVAEADESRNEVFDATLSA